MLLPFHPELVPRLGVAAHVREEEVARRALARLWKLKPGAPSRKVVARELLAIPRIDDPGSRDDGGPCGDGHGPEADRQPSRALDDPLLGQPAAPKAVETRETPCEGKQEERPEHEAVYQAPEFAIRQLHAHLPAVVVGCSAAHGQRGIGGCTYPGLWESRTLLPADANSLWRVLSGR